MRLAKPGDIAIVVQDEWAEGRNLGKQCAVIQQCSCWETKWLCEALEPQYEANVFGSIMPVDCGHSICYGKTHLIVKEDPDEQGEKQVDDKVVSEPRSTAGIR